MPAKSLPSRDRRSEAPASLHRSASQSTKDIGALDLNNFNDKDFEEMLQKLSAGNRDAEGPAADMLKHSDKEVAKEEKEAAKTFRRGDMPRTVPEKRSTPERNMDAEPRGRPGRNDYRIGANRNKRDVQRSGPMMIPQQLGSAGSSKASSNASDESEELDHAASLHSTLFGFEESSWYSGKPPCPSCARLAVAFVSGRSGSFADTQKEVEDNDNLGSESMIHGFDSRLDSFGADDGMECDDDAPGSRTLHPNAHERDSGAPQSGDHTYWHNTSDNVETGSHWSRQNDLASNEPSGSAYSHPSVHSMGGVRRDYNVCHINDETTEKPLNENYSNKLKGRKQKLDKLSKYPRKKLESGGEHRAAYDRALKKATLDGLSDDQLLDALAAQKNSDSNLMVRDLEAGGSFPIFVESHPVKRGKNGQRAQRSPQSVRSSVPPNEIPYTPLVNKASDHSDTSDSPRVSDHDHSPPLSREGSRFSDKSYQSPKAEFSGSSNCDIGEKGFAAQAQNHDRSFKSGQGADSDSSESKDGSTGVEHGWNKNGSLHQSAPSRKLEETVIVIRPELDIADASTSADSSQKKKKKKKKSKRKGESLTSKESDSLPHSKDEPLTLKPAVPEVVSYARLPVDPVPRDPVVPEPSLEDLVFETPVEEEFQIVTRRLPSKSSPPSKAQNGSYVNGSRHGTRNGNRNVQGMNKHVKQSVSATVPPVQLEYPQLRRRNSAGDIKKGVMDPDPVGMDVGGDNSDRDSVRSMPVSKNAKSGAGKTTSAPATRLPTPGISYADIAKGTHNGSSHTSTEHTVRPINHVETAETIRLSSPLPVVDVSSIVVENRRDSTSISHDVVPVPQEAPVVAHVNNHTRHNSDYGQSYYPDFGETTNIHTHETHMALLRTMKPAPPLAPRVAPVVYRRPNLDLPPLRENRHSANRKNGPRNRGGIQTQVFESKGYRDQRNMYLAEQGRNDRGTEQNVWHRSVPNAQEGGRGEDQGSGLENRDSFAVPVTEAPGKSPGDTTLLKKFNHAEIIAYMISTFEEARKACLEGRPGYQLYKNIKPN